MSKRPFSMKWMLISMVIFIGTELVLGGLVGEYLLGRYMSISLKFTLQGLLNLVSYFIGGLVVGFISPGLRISEPAVGAFLSVGIMLTLTQLTPYRFMDFSLTKLIIGGFIACFLAFVGAELGERLSGNKVE